MSLCFFMGRPFRVLIHKPGDLPAVCTKALALMPRVKLAVRINGYVVKKHFRMRVFVVRSLLDGKSVFLLHERKRL